MTFQWIKGHSGDQENDKSNLLAKRGAEKDELDILDLSIPIKFNLQGTKLATFTQSEAYWGIHERQEMLYRASIAANLKLAKTALSEYNGELEMDASIWRSTQTPIIQTKIRQFLFRMMHQMSLARDKDSKSRVRALSRGYNVIDKSHLSEGKMREEGAQPRSPTSGSRDNTMYCPQ